MTPVAESWNSVAPSKAEGPLPTLGLQAVLDAIPFIVFLKDTHNRIVRVNRTVANSLGVTCEEMAGTHTKRWYPDEADAYYADDLEVIRTGQPKLGIVEPLQVEELRVIRKKS